MYAISLLSFFFSPSSASSRFHGMLTGGKRFDFLAILLFSARSTFSLAISRFLSASAASLNERSFAEALLS